MVGQRVQKLPPQLVGDHQPFVKLDDPAQARTASPLAVRLVAFPRRPDSPTHVQRLRGQFPPAHPPWAVVGGVPSPTAG